MNLSLSLLLGIVFGSIGSVSILKTLHKREVIKLKKYFSSQQESFDAELQQNSEAYDQQLSDQAATHQTEQQQLQAQLQQTQTAKEALAQQLTAVRSQDQLLQGQQLKSSAEITVLQQQLHQQIAAKENILVQLEKEKEKAKARQRELRENSSDIDEILDTFEAEQQALLDKKNQEIAVLSEENKTLAINLEQLKSELFTVKQQHKQQSIIEQTHAFAPDFSAEKITELLEALFPGIVLLRDSITELTNHPENLVKLVKAIKDIYEGHPYAPTKVRATDKKWTECRVPHINLMRIYFQKCKKESGYQILISPKKNQKSQDQDYEWLKNHQVC